MPAYPIRNYLLALDGSIHANRAAEYVAHRAAKLGPCQVHIVDVHAFLGGGEAEQEDLLAAAGAETTYARRVLDGAGLPYQFHAELGDPAGCILEGARVHGCDEVVVGSRGLSALGSLAIGSVAYKVVHLAQVPVTVIPNPYGAPALELEDGGSVHRVLLAVDGSAASTGAVEYACALKRAAIPVEVHLVNVQILPASGNVRRFVSQDVIDAYCREEGELALAPARQALQEAGLSYEARVITGQAAQGIVKEAMTAGCTRIVMGTRGLGALGNAIVGSTAMKVMHLSEIPVTLVK